MGALLRRAVAVGLGPVSKLGLLCALACAHGGSTPESRADLGKYPLIVAAEVLVNNPVLAERGQELRAALASALGDEGFQVAARPPQPGDLLARLSLDLAAWSSVSPSSLYVVVKLERDGAPVDEVAQQRINEGFPEKERVPELARALAHSLARSPRTAEFLRTGGAMPAPPLVSPETPPQVPAETPPAPDAPALRE